MKKAQEQTRGVREEIQQAEGEAVGEEPNRGGTEKA
jgi:hypothetical protein